MLAKKVGAAAGWSLLANLFQQITAFVLFLYLARVLSPHDFGIAAMAFAVTETFGLLSRLGIAEVIQQRREIDETAKSTAFWLLIATGIIFGLLILGTADTVEQGMSLAGLAPVLVVCAPLCLLTNAACVHESMIKRDFGFKWLAARTAVASLVGSLVGAAAAYLGYGVYALVAQRLSTVAVICVMVWVNYHWVPKLRFSPTHALDIMKNGVQIAIASLMSFVNPRLVDIIVGYMLGATALGLLRIASRIFDLLNQLCIMPLISVALVALSFFRDDLPAMGRTYLKFSQLAALLLIPVFVGLAAVADRLVPILFGPDWEGAIVPFQMMAILSAAAPINFFFGPTMVAAGKPRLVMIQAAIQIALTLVLTIAAAPFGLLYVLGAHILRAYLISLINCMMLRSAVGLSLASVAARLAPPVVSSIAMVVAVALEHNLLDLGAGSGTVASIATSVAVGAIVYPAVFFLGDVAGLWPRYIAGLKRDLTTMLRQAPASVPAG